MAKEKAAKDLMTTPVSWATPGQILRDVAKVMLERSFSQLSVRNGEKNVGRVTDGMIVEELRKSEGSEVATKKVKNLPKYGRTFREVQPDDPYRKVVSFILQDEAILVKAEPRIERWGIITRANILDHLIS